VHFGQVSATKGTHQRCLLTPGAPGTSSFTVANVQGREIILQHDNAQHHGRKAGKFSNNRPTIRTESHRNRVTAIPLQT